MLKVLILEDNEAKFNHLIEKIYLITDKNKIEQVTNLNDAKKKLMKKQYDIFLVDVQVPKRKDETPEPNAGIELIKEIRVNTKLLMPKHTIVITEYKEIFKKYSKELNEKMVSFLEYSISSNSWETKLVNKLIEIKRSQVSLKKSIVFAVHGFNTRGDWKNTLSPILSEDENMKFLYYPWDYGTFKFGIISPWSRKNLIKSFQSFYNDKMYKYKNEDIEVCLVAHSFGTYITCEAIAKYPEIYFDKVIYLGSPIKESFDWEGLEHKIKKLLFYIGESDKALSLAPFIGLGKSGKKGFLKKPDFIEYLTYKKLSHSDMFGKKNMKDIWIPFFKK